jgi:hypothetical protein
MKSQLLSFPLMLPKEPNRNQTLNSCASASIPLLKKANAPVLSRLMIKL